MVLTAAVMAAGFSASCETKEPTSSTYFERTIAPILTTSCARTNTGAGCHVADEKGNALGNLDTTTFAGVAKRVMHPPRMGDEDVQVSIAVKQHAAFWKGCRLMNCSTSRRFSERACSIRRWAFPKPAEIAWQG